MIKTKDTYLANYLFFYFINFFEILKNFNLLKNVEFFEFHYYIFNEYQDLC
jgi:hypothetical protein